MPLFPGKSKSDFNYDDAKGTKPDSLAMAYGMKRRAKKAHGDLCAHGGDAETCPKCTYPKDSSSKNDPTEMERMHMAEGGMMHAEDEWDGADYNKKRLMHPDEAAMREDERKLGQHGDIEEGPDGVPPNSPKDELHDKAHREQTGNYSDTEDGDGTDMVGRIIAQRQRMFSKGGQVANEDEIEAGFSPNEFDDLHLDDKLEQHDTGENSGDYIGDEGEDERREDIVSRIMRSRRKGPGHNPRPA